ncbi:Cys-tRNA(Pro) deacylase [Propioniciclava sp.]|uniref:Cys-tRNA(Pro) deacylase n=1 Tax=Propioniciclava sp. TaxID=2038686 RepID=UPI00263471AC|nr:Cys-tRNA(Pro) deacylase [Propioniciclava sp.]
MARKDRAAGGTPATDALVAAGVPFTALEYTHHDDATDYGAEVVRETGRDAEQVFKTLVVSTGRRDLAVGVVPVAGMLDLKAMAAALGVKKVEMAAPAVAERSSGYVVGGVSPVGQRTPLPTVIDDTAQLFDTIVVSGGKRGLQIELSPDDLADVTGASFAPIGR